MSDTESIQENTRDIVTGQILWSTAALTGAFEAMVVNCIIVGNPGAGVKQWLGIFFASFIVAVLAVKRRNRLRFSFAALSLLSGVAVLSVVWLSVEVSLQNYETRIAFWPCMSWLIPQLILCCSIYLLVRNRNFRKRA